MLQNSLKYMSKYQPVTLDFSSEYLKHICLDTYGTKIHIVKWMIHKHWYAVFDDAESSYQLIV